jgi:hypothetical protein
MSDSVKPVRPIRAVQPISEIRPRVQPSFFQLQQWLNFVRRKNKDKNKDQPKQPPKRDGESGN